VRAAVWGSAPFELVAHLGAAIHDHLVDRLGDLEVVRDQHRVSLFRYAWGSFSNAERQPVLQK